MQSKRTCKTARVNSNNRLNSRLRLNNALDKQGSQFFDKANLNNKGIIFIQDSDQLQKNMIENKK